MEKSVALDLINFEKAIASLWDQGKIPYPVHLSGGNEDILIKIFKEINPEDYIFSTHRSHFHYLLKGGSPEKLEKMILEGKSMHIFDKEINFLSSSIVAGNAGIAAGVAYALKRNDKTNHVWCFLGDGAEEEGHFYEAVRYVDGQKLPCTFIIEDNGFSVETPKNARYGDCDFIWPSCVKRYTFKRTYPHVGTGKFVDFSGEKAGGSSF
ncbi:MAG: thiamine pyrophosphate-dependent enzyme [Nanoarchaeota archaeon]